MDNELYKNLPQKQELDLEELTKLGQEYAKLNPRVRKKIRAAKEAEFQARLWKLRREKFGHPTKPEDKEDVL